MTAIGDPIIRVDGKLKVTGAAKYAAEFEVPNTACGVIVTSTIANGRIQRMDTAEARSAAGVLTIMTPSNAPKLPQGGKAGVHPPAGRVLSLLQDTQVHYNNQPIAVVVAETLNQALHAASLIRVQYQIGAACARLRERVCFLASWRPWKGSQRRDRGPGNGGNCGGGSEGR